jgi:adenylate cyclase
MAAPPVKRKLVAILAADAVGYSRLMAEDEEGTVRVLAAHRSVIDGIIEYHDGRIVGTAGDSVLAEFASPVEALRCAVEIQAALETRNASLPEARRLRFRIGINLGDVMVKGDDLLGDGVNVAARLEGIAQPGGICISSSVYDQIAGKLDLGFVEMGAQNLKNIDRPIRAYSVQPGAAGVKAAPRKRPRSAAPILAGLAAVVALGVGAAWWAYLRSNAASPAPLPVASVAPPPVAPATPPAASAEREAPRIAPEVAAARGARPDPTTAQPASLPPKAIPETKVAVEPLTVTRPQVPRQSPRQGPADAVAWAGTLHCDAASVGAHERPAVDERVPVHVENGAFVLQRRLAARGGFFRVEGTPASDGTLQLAGVVIPPQGPRRGREVPARLEGRLEGGRYVVNGNLGPRACRIEIARR